jgi:hypothetical protein
VREGYIERDGIRDIEKRDREEKGPKQSWIGMVMGYIDGYFVKFMSDLSINILSPTYLA